MTLGVVIERLRDGELKEEQVLEHTLRPSTLFGKRVVLRHIPLKSDEVRNSTQVDDKDRLDRLIKTLVQTKEWLPVLTVGTEHIIKSSFTVLGEKKPRPLGEIVSPAAGLGGGIKNVLGGITGAVAVDESESGKSKQSYLTGEWIEYTLSMPGEAPLTIRQEVFDLLGPLYRTSIEKRTPNVAEAERKKRALALASETYILLQASLLSRSFLLNLLGTDMDSIRDVLLEIVLAKYARKTVEQQRGVWLPQLGPEHSLALARKEFNHMRSNVYLNRVNIISYTKGMRLRARNQPTTFRAFDIVFNRVGVFACTECTVDSFLVRLRQGVLDTNLEALLVKRRGAAIENTAELFERSLARGLSWRAVHSIGRDTRKNIKTGNSVYGYVVDDLRDGCLVVLPETPMVSEPGKLFGWWRICPDGSCLGRIGSGKGGALTEEATLLAKVGFTFLCGYTLAHAHDDMPTHKTTFDVLFCTFMGGASWGAYFLEWHILSKLAIVAELIHLIVAH